MPLPSWALRAEGDLQNGCGLSLVGDSGELGSIHASPPSACACPFPPQMQETALDKHRRAAGAAARARGPGEHIKASRGSGVSTSA